MDLPSDDDYVAVWALMDSCSAVHVVDATKVFPKAKTHPAPKGHTGFKAASGTHIPRQGFVYTDVRTMEGGDKTVRWHNAKVELPMLSTRELKRN